MSSKLCERRQPNYEGAWGKLCTKCDGYHRLCDQWVRGMLGEVEA